MQAGVRAFVLAAGNLSGREMAEVFVKALPAMRRFVTQHSSPFIARVTQSGAVSMLWSVRRGNCPQRRSRADC